MRRHKKRRMRMAEMNVVPYIDIMLVLLIIFMTTAQTLKPSVNVALPYAQNTQTNEPVSQPIIITIKDEQTFHIDNGDAISLEELKQRLRTQQNHSNLHYHLQADGHLPYHIVVKVMVAMRASGAKNINLVFNRQN